MNLFEQLRERLKGIAAGRGFYIILGVTLLIGVVFRTLYLTADPPIGITRSQDFSTDPFQYVYFAENAVDKGTANPYDDPSYGQWRHTTQNILALVIFNLFGTGRAEGNAVSVIFSIASILLLALAIKNFGSRLGALFFAILASLDFTLVWFGRTPFLEASQNFWLCASVYLFSCKDRHWLFLAGSGLACALASFYAKMIAVFMLGAFAALWILIYLHEEEKRKETIQSAIRFYGGYLLGLVSWLLLVYFPVQRQISGYLSEQAVGLYGAPKAFDSVKDFVWQYISLLWEHEFFLKMPIVTILAYLFGAAVLVWFVGKHSDKKLFGNFNVGWVMLLLWFVLGYLLLFPWNYRPLRYQTTLMLPAMAMAGIALAYAFEHSRSSNAPPAKSKTADRGAKRSNPTAHLVLWAVWLLPALSLVLLWFASIGDGGTADAIKANAIPYALVLLVVGAVVALALRGVRRASPGMLTVGAALATLVMLFLIVSNVVRYVDWSSRRQYTLMAADRDLGAILSSGAVISGPYVPALAQENRFGRIFHMFGTTRVDKAYFARYPITHLLMDEGNEKRAREDYPEIMGNADLITWYIVRGVPVRLYRISGVSPNEQARQYQPSDYERAKAFIGRHNNDSAAVYMQRFMANGTPNYSANAYAAEALYSQGRYADAIGLYQKVQQFSPGDGSSAANLANCYMALGSSAGGGAYFDSALVYYKIARAAFPQDRNLAETIKGLERRRR